jgi:hypothetical protein
MNFNLDLKVDKAMNKLSESKTLRVWTYIICCVFLFGITIWKADSILMAIARILEVLK